MRTVGVLGGMGPEATILFMQRLLAATPARDDRDHIPLLVDQNTQVPSRIAALIEGGGADPAPVLAAMAARLEAAGAEALAMPCNTAHHYADAIRAAVSVPFLSMVDLSVAALADAHPGAAVGVLASPAVAITGLYDAPLRRAGLRPLHPADRSAMLAAIRALKVSAADPAAQAAACEAARGLVAGGAQALLIACSEFSLIRDALAEVAPALDSLDVLVAATADFSRAAAR